MDPISPLHFFRDQYKNPDLYPPDPVEKRKIQEMIEEDRAKKASQNPTEEKVETLETFGPTGEAYKQTIDIIRQAGLKPEFASNSAELEIIEKRKNTALTYLAKILEDAKNYLAQVNYLQIQKAADYEDPEKYQHVVGESDELRRNYHNKLIQDIKIANRLINVNFNIDFPENLRLAEEAKLTDRLNLKPDELKTIMEQREYSKFPFSAGIFLDLSRAPKDQKGERDYFGYWALQIYSDLSALENEIKNEIKTELKN